MDFRFDEEQVARRDAIQALCRQHFPVTQLAARESGPAGAEAWRALADMGVFAMLVAGEHAGLGGRAVDAAVVFEQLGAHLVTGPVLWSTIAAPLLPDAAGGECRVCGIERAPAQEVHVIEHATESDVVVVIDEDRVTSFPTGALGVPQDGEPLDPLTPASAYRALPIGDAIGSAEDARRLRLAGTVLTAAQLVGGAQGALDVASAYALERHQFGAPIGSFQAVKHLLADMYVRVELARSATYAAAAMFDDDHAGDAVTAASTAKLLAGDAGIANGRTAVQVLGGMGFTWEMAPHYFLKRAWVLEETFGTGDAHALVLSAALESDVPATLASWT